MTAAKKIEKKKVIKGLECLAQMNEPIANPCSKCGYHDRPNFAFCVKDIASDALAMLKEQEPVKAVADGEDSYVCNNCGTVIGWVELDQGGIVEVKYKFCPECGRAVKWE